MGARDVVVIGASGGGVEALIRLVPTLPRDLPAAVFVVVHMSAATPSVLPRILGRNGAMPASHAVDGEPVRPGHIFVAPPGRRLMLLPDKVGVNTGPRENMHRPAIDVLFRSAASVYGSRVVGVILTGSLDDGTAGLWAVKRRGGYTIVQEPKDALFSGMPASAIEVVHPHLVLKLDEIGPAIVRLVAERAGSLRPAARPDLETAIQRRGAGDMDDNVAGKPTQFICPECHGPLTEIDDGGVSHLRCHTGHAFSSDSLFSSQVDDIERALWGALRALEESAALARLVADRHERADRQAKALGYRERARLADESSTTIKQLLRDRAVTAEDVDDAK